MKTLRTVSRTLLAAVVMGIVCYGVKVEMSQLVGSWQLQDGDFRRPVALAAKLRSSDTPLSSYLYANLSDTAMQSTDDCMHRTSLRKALISDLNRLIQGPSLYSEKFFAKSVPHSSMITSITSIFGHSTPNTKIKITDEIKKLIEQDPKGKDLAHLNRLLLAAAFPSCISGSGADNGCLLNNKDIDNYQKLSLQFADTEKPFSKYLMAHITAKTRELLAPQTILVGDLNRLIQGPSLYSERYFTKSVPHRSILASITSIFKHHAPNTKIKITDEIKKLIEQDPKGKDLAHLNRLLLAAAFPSHISGSGADNGWLLDNNDIDDYQKLSLQFADSQKPFSMYLMAQLTAKTRELLAPQIMPFTLMHDMNLLINSKSLYSSERFTGIVLPVKVQALAEKNPAGKQMVKLNRLLLESAYPQEIVKRPPDRVESKMGSALTVLLAMGLGGIVYFILLRLLKVDEMDYLWQALKRKFTKRPRNGKTTEPLEVNIEP